MVGSIWVLALFGFWLGLIGVGCMRFLSFCGVFVRFRSAWMGRFHEFFGFLWSGC